MGMAPMIAHAISGRSGGSRTPGGSVTALTPDVRPCRRGGADPRRRRRAFYAVTFSALAVRSLNRTVNVAVTTPAATEVIVYGPGVAPKFCSVAGSVRSIAFSVGNENGF